MSCDLNVTDESINAVGKKFQAIKQWLLLTYNSLTLSLSIICCGLSVGTSPLSVSTLLSELVTVVLESVVGFSESTPSIKVQNDTLQLCNVFSTLYYKHFLTY